MIGFFRSLYVIALLQAIHDHYLDGPLNTPEAQAAWIREQR